MRAIPPILAAFTALAVVSAEAATNSNSAIWHPLGPALSFALGDRGCGDGWHQALWRDWRGDWWWGPLRAQMTWVRSADASMVCVIEAARICLLIFGCAAAGWALGFGMGYRRGVNDAITSDVDCAGPRFGAASLSD